MRRSETDRTYRMVRIEWAIQLRAARRPPAKPRIKPTDAFSIQSPASSSRARAGVIAASVVGASHTIRPMPTKPIANRLMNTHFVGISSLSVRELRFTSKSVASIPRRRRRGIV